MSFFKKIFTSFRTNSTVTNEVSKVQKKEKPSYNTLEDIIQWHEKGDKVATIKYAYYLSTNKKTNEARAILNPLLAEGMPEAEVVLSNCFLMENSSNLTNDTIKEWRHLLEGPESKGCYMAFSEHGSQLTTLQNPTSPSCREAVECFKKLVDMPKNYPYVSPNVFNTFAYLCFHQGAYSDAMIAATKGASYGELYCLLLAGVAYLPSANMGNVVNWGVNPNIEMAEHYFKKCIQAKDTPYAEFNRREAAYVNLFEIEAGRRNLEVAMKYAKKGAELGDGYSMRMLSLAYRNGKGVKKDLDKAAEWEQKAISAGFGREQSQSYNVFKLLLNIK